MTPTTVIRNSPLIGLYFHSRQQPPLNEARFEIQHQGRVEALLPSGAYLVTLFSFLTGSSLNQEIWTEQVGRLGDARFYNDSADMAEAFEI